MTESPAATETPTAAPDATETSTPAPGADATPTSGTDGLTTDIVPGPGGVMTDEVGVVTGELTLRTEVADATAVLRVQYKEADEWYTVTGGRATLTDPADGAAVHKIAVGLLHRPEG